MRECEYDSHCTGGMYSHKENACIKAVSLEYVDDEHLFHSNTNDGWEFFIKKPHIAPYYNAYCAQWTSAETCSTSNTNGRCKWGEGKRGYNQMRFTDTGYCGRVVC